jgi:hypothetical protein
MLYQAWKPKSAPGSWAAPMTLQWSHALSSMETFPLTVVRSIAFSGLLGGEVGRFLMIWQGFCGKLMVFSLHL